MNSSTEGSKLSNYAPSLFAFSPDDRCLTFLHAPSANDSARQLWAADMESLRVGPLLSAPAELGDTEETLSLDEKLRRERRRAYTLGITQYAWPPPPPSSSSSSSLIGQQGQGQGQGQGSGRRLLIPLQGSLYVQELEGGGPQAGSSLRCIYHCHYGPCAHQEEEEDGALMEEEERGGPAIDPQFSPDGQWVAFVRGVEVFAVSVEGPSSGGSVTGGGQVVQLTQGAQGVEGMSNGLADFVAQEEMDRYSGFWWGPCGVGFHASATNASATNEGKASSSSSSSGPMSSASSGPMLAYVEVDERHVPEFVITHMHAPQEEGGGGGESVQELHRYPFAGKRNATSRLLVVDTGLGDRATAGTSNGPSSSSMGPSSSSMEGLPSSSSSARGRKRRREIQLSGHGGGAREATEYLARLHWLPDGRLTAQVQNRDQTLLRLLLADPRSPSPSLGPPNGFINAPQVLERVCSGVILEERSDYWVNLHDLFHPLKNIVWPKDVRGGVGSGSAEGAFSFLWGSERSGFMHLYLYTYIPDPSCSVPVPAHLVRALTFGEWMVEEIAGVDEASNVVYVMGSADGPLERHLYAVPLLAPSPTPPLRLTAEAGMHTVKIDHQCRHFVDVYSSLESPSKTRVLSLPSPPLFPSPPSPPSTLLPPHHNGSSPTPRQQGPSSSLGSGLPRVLECRLVLHIHDMADKKLQAGREKLVIPEIFRFTPPNSTVELYGALYRPNASIHGPGPYPTVVSVYGGPNAQKVHRSWALTVDMMAQRLRELGLAVVKVDNRGSARRGLLFEGALRWNLGDVEVQDQAHAVDFLVGEGVVKAGHVGMYGWSYGGYMSCMALCKAPTHFRVAVAGAPVTSWDGYDTHYTERYMGTPAANAEGYERASVLRHVDKLQGKLLLVHGMIDENVHFRHTTRLVSALVAARKPYDLMLFPEGRHSLRKAEDRVYLEQRLLDFFVSNLSLSGGGGAGAPPTPFGKSSVNAHL